MGMWFYLFLLETWFESRNVRFKNLERIKIMSKDLNIIQFSYSKDLQPLVEDLINDVREFFKTREQNELALEQARLKASKEKWDAALKAINKNGALDRIMLQAADKFMSDPNASPKINTKLDEDYIARIKNSKSERAEKISLVSLIAELNTKFDSEPEIRKLMNSVIDKISVHESIYNLLKCTNEDDARITLNYIRSNVSEHDLPYLINLNNFLISSDKELVGKIVNFHL